jgi:predicted permease
MVYTDLRYGVRSLRLRAGSSAAIVLTLALAVGVNSTLFTLVNAALLAPLPVANPDTLVNIYTTREDGTGYGGLSYPDFLDLRAASPALEDALGYSGLMTTVTGEGPSEVIFGELVTANYFSLLGVPPALGRGFLPVEGEERGAHHVVVIGDRLWRRRFAADPSVVGQTISLNGRPYTIVGVAPKEFGGLLFRALSADVWIPVSMMGALRTDQLDNRDERWMFVKGRLKPGATVAAAEAASEVVGSRLRAVHADTNKGRTFRVLASSDVIVHPDGDRAVFVAAGGAMGAGLLVLIVACANLAGVMLARGQARRREFAIRLSIGAGRSAIVRQLLVESALLSCVGGMAGLLAARWLASALASWRPELPVPVSLNTIIDSRVTLFTFGLTAAATMLFALVPALRASRIPPAGSMALAMARGQRRLFGLRDAVLVPQLAIAMALIAVAGLLARSLSRADAVVPGFDLARTGYVALNLSMSGYDEVGARRFYERLSASLPDRGLIETSAVTSRVPLDLYGNQSATIAIGDAQRSVQIAQVGYGYFEAMGIPLLQGRRFEASDEQPAAQTAVIVSVSAARAWWPDSPAVGQTVRFEASGAPARVIGIAADVKVQTLDESPQLLVYRPLTSGHAGLLRLVVRSSVDPASSVTELRRAVHELDSTVAVFEARTMGEHLDVMLYPYRLAAVAGTAFGLLSIGLAGIGLYGVLACSVSERRRDLAIRLALGAPILALLRAAAGETSRAVLVAAVCGGFMALVSGRLLADVLFSVSPYDPVSLVVTAVVLGGVVVAASAGPLLRACRCDVTWGQLSIF